MFALISPYEQSWSNSTFPESPILLGQRVVEVSETEFPVALPLFWMPCANDVVADQYYYDSSKQKIIKKP